MRSFCVAAPAATFPPSIGLLSPVPAALVPSSVARLAGALNNLNSNSCSCSSSSSLASWFVEFRVVSGSAS